MDRNSFNNIPTRWVHMSKRIVFRIWSPDSTEYEAYFFEVSNPTPEKVRLANEMFAAKAEEYHRQTGFHLRWRRVRLNDDRRSDGDEPPAAASGDEPEPDGGDSDPRWDAGT